MTDNLCAGLIPITSSSRGQYQIFDAYQSLNDKVKGKINEVLGWRKSDELDYLNTRESGDWFDHEGRDPEEEFWLSDAIEEVTGWTWEDGSLWEYPSDCEGCPNCGRED